MLNRDLRVRIKHYSELCLRDALSQTVAPLTDQTAMLGYIGVLIVLLFLGPLWGPGRRIEAAISSTQSILVFVWSLPIFLILNALRAPFRVAKRDREMGAWRGDRFVYRQRQLVFMVSVDESDNFDVHRFSMPDIPSGSSVWYVVENDRSDMAVATALVEPNEVAEKGWNREHHPSGCIRLSNKGELSLRVQVGDQTNLTTLRVYATAWSASEHPSQ